MLVQVWASGSVVFLAIVGLALSNYVHDRGVPSAMSRYVAPVIGGGAFLVAVVWLDMWTAVILSSIPSILVLVLRLRYRRNLRGVKGSLPTQDWAEATYAVAGAASLAVGWGLMDDKWLAFLPIAYMAWGDSAAGFLRNSVWRDNVASKWPSLAMLGVCLLAAALYEPYWVGATGATAATLAERRRPMLGRFWDDNLHLVVVSLLVMGVLAKLGL